MVWENLNMPGLTNSDKKKLHEKSGKEIFNNDDLKIFLQILYVYYKVSQKRELKNI